MIAKIGEEIYEVIYLPKNDKRYEQEGALILIKENSLYDINERYWTLDEYNDIPEDIKQKYIGQKAWFISKENEEYNLIPIKGNKKKLII